VSAKALEALGYIAVKHGIITRAERDADEINPSDAFGKRIKQGMDALTVWKEMDKVLIKKQELFRDFASTSMLVAADGYDSGTTQALIARPIPVWVSRRGGQPQPRQQDVMAANAVDGKPNSSQMADVSVANTLSAHRQDFQEKEIKKREQ
jgi:hypothetical protein